MKTIITPNSRPLHRALCALLIGIAALWAMPGNARAQLYVSQNEALVSEYNATTGAAIDANFITGLNLPFGIALSGNDLFVSNRRGDPLGTTVGKYNATTGAAINASFITGLNDPTALAVSGNDLFEANGLGNTVGKYNATNGAVINPNFITGLNLPTGIALRGNDLFVANNGSFTVGTVGKYNATTGAAINASFITGLSGPAALAVAPVPEPSPWAMIAIGGVAFLGIMLRKKHCIA